MDGHEAFVGGECNACHKGGILAYLAGDGKFSEFAHKARWGIPNTSMARSVIGSPDATGVIDLFIPAGAKWGAAFNPADRTEIPWGSGTFSFSSCGSGHIALAPNQAMQDNGFTSLEYDINRDLLIPGIACPISTQ